MPRRRVGQVRFRNGRWYARVTVNKNRRPTFELPTCSSEPSARARAAEMSRIVTDLRKADRLDLANAILARAAHATDMKPVRTMVAKLVAGQYQDAPRPACEVTFEKLGRQWTSGELHRKHPKRVKLKASAKDDEYRLAKLFPALGSLTLDAITVDHVDDALDGLDGELSPNTVKQYAQVVRRVLALAVYPCKLIPVSPIPAGWLPPGGSSKAFGFLYPEEEAQLMAGTERVVMRLFWGFMAREGLRKGEALRLTWDAIDLKRGNIRLDKNKTNAPREWPLGEDVARALRTWRKLNPGTVYVFDGVGADPRAASLRDAMKAAGIDRPELYESTDERQPFRIHDLRSTMITLRLAMGWSERWVMDRSGHTTSGQLQNY